MNGGHFLVASVVSIQNSSFVYPSCHSCFSRLSLQFKRYNCQKCGCSGDAKEANYRYRLALEAAGTCDVFEVTVFGSCLDAYFGVTAKALQRYIEELTREAGEEEEDAVPGAVFRAVETCFVGKKFVFRIKGSDVASSLQNGCPTEGSPKTLVACEMSVPHPGLVGCTVIHRLEQQRWSQFKQSHGALWPPDLVTASDHPSRELKSLHLSSGLDVTQSSHGNDFSAFWPYSFGLTWSSASSENAEHSADSVSHRTDSEQLKCVGGSITSHGQVVYNLGDQNPMQDEGGVHEGEGSRLYPSPERVPAVDQRGRRPSIKRKDDDVPESPLALMQEASPYKISIRSSRGLGNSRCSTRGLRPKAHLPPSPSPGGTVAMNSREFSSESLIEFLAKLDNENVSTGLPNVQERRSASRLCEKSGENKEGGLLLAERGCSLRGKGACCSPLVDPSRPEANFDASADLFDVSLRGSTKTTLATLPGPQRASPWAGALTPDCRTSEFMPGQGKENASWTNSHDGLSLHDTAVVPAPTTSTPIAGWVVKSERSLVGTLDFAARPHAVPFARPRHPGSQPAGKGSILRETRLNKSSGEKARGKRSRLPLKNSLVKQLVSKFSPPTRSCDAEAGRVSRRGSPRRILAQELPSEEDGQEWSPPSGKIKNQDAKSWARKRRKSVIGIPSDGQVTNRSPPLEKQVGSPSPRRLSRLAKVEFLPEKRQPEEAGVEGQRMCQQRPAPGLPFIESPDKPALIGFSRSELLPTPSPVSQVADWSSELFSGHDQLPNVEATVSAATS